MIRSIVLIIASSSLVFVNQSRAAASDISDVTTFYKIVNTNTSKVLAIEDDSDNAGSHAVLVKDVGPDDKQAKARQWKLEKDGNYIKLTNRQFGLALDVEGESADEGANIIVWDDKSDGIDNQRWALNGQDNPHRIQSKLSGLVLDVEDGNIVQHAANEKAKSQLWQLVEIKAPRYFKLVNVASGKLLATEDDSADSGAHTILAADPDAKPAASTSASGGGLSNSASTGSAASVSKPAATVDPVEAARIRRTKQWQFVKDGDFYKLVNRHSGLVLDVNGDSTDEGAEIIVWNDKDASEGNDNQRWSWDGKVLPTGTRLKSKSSGHVLDVDGGGLVQKKSDPQAKGQLWIIVEVKD
jgi:hypothetical protein